MPDTLDETREKLEMLEMGWGDPWSARSALIDALKTADSGLRGRALAHSAEIVDSDDMAGLHLDILEDGREQPSIRARAAIALGPALELCAYGWWDDPHDPPPLTRSYFATLQKRLQRIYHSAEAPKLVRRRVLEAAVRAPDDWQRRAIRAAWTGEDDEWRQTAVFGAGYLGDFSDLLGEALDCDEPPILSEALYAAADRHDLPGLSERMLELAADPARHDEVRLAAIAGLRYVESHRAWQILSDLRHHPDERIGQMASWALDEWEIFSEAPGMEDLDLPRR